MGKKDLSLKTYLSDPARYADVYNGSVFGGAQVLDASQLEEAATVATKSDGGLEVETICDIAMRQKAGGGLFALWILENQEEMDYGLTVRVLLREALEYDRQVKGLRRGNAEEYREKSGELTAGEYLYGVKRSDRICPVVTLVIYWGNKPWDGPKSLHEFIDFGRYDKRLAEEIKKLVPEYPLHILNLNEKNDYSVFHTSLRTVFELYACRADKGEFADYVKTHKECRRLDTETYEIIGKLMGAVRLSKIQEKAEGEEEQQDMWKAIEDLIEDGKAEGKREGKIEGKQEGRIDKASQLISIIGSIMEKLHCTLEEACEIAGQSVEEYRQAREFCQTVK